MEIVARLCCLILIVIQVSCASRLLPVEEWSWRTDNEDFKVREISQLSKGLRYIFTISWVDDVRKFHFMSIDRENSSDPAVDCEILNDTLSKINLRSVDEFGDKLLVQSWDTHILILDPKSCVIEKVLWDVSCTQVQINGAESFDCVCNLDKEKPYPVTRYDQNGELVRTFKIDFDEDFHDIRALEEPTDELSYFIWNGCNEGHRTNLKLLNATYGIVRDVFLPIASANYMPGKSALEHDKLTLCRAKDEEQATDEILCKTVHVKDTSNLVKFSFWIPLSVLNYSSRLYVYNLERGAIVLHQTHEDRKLYYRIVNEAGAIDDEDRLFYEYDKRLNTDYIHPDIFEENDNLCVRLHNRKNYVFTKCVKVLF